LLKGKGVMAKRKPARRTSSSRGRAPSGKRTTTRSGAAARRTSAGKTRAAAGRKSGAKKSQTSTRKKTTKAASARKAAGRSKAAARARTQPPARGPKKTAARARTSTKKTAKARSKAPAAKTLPRRESAARRRQIERDQREIQATLPMPPSTLDLDRQPSAARSGRAEMAEALNDHNAADPAITAGDVDADWASAYSTGDEAPGGDMPTPDQDVVEEIGTALGVQYNDDEELKGADKIERRDKHRWELDPASSEDYQDRSRQK
jgi:hypothetical protein